MVLDGRISHSGSCLAILMAYLLKNNKNDK
jgi:hypothetical protein